MDIDDSVKNVDFYQIRWIHPEYPVLCQRLGEADPIPWAATPAGSEAADPQDVGRATLRWMASSMRRTCDRV
jgi:hypothetical protein